MVRRRSTAAESRHLTLQLLRRPSRSEPGATRSRRRRTRTRPRRDQPDVGLTVITRTPDVPDHLAGRPTGCTGWAVSHGPAGDDWLALPADRLFGTTNSVDDSTDPNFESPRRTTCRTSHGEQARLTRVDSRRDVLRHPSHRGGRAPPACRIGARRHRTSEDVPTERRLHGERSRGHAMRRRRDDAMRDRPPDDAGAASP